MKLLKMYHGTSDVFKIKKILPPIETGELREEWRKKIRDKVFITPSIMSAEKFAKKAATKYGGNGVVYEVRPHGQVDNINANEYICDYADIIKVEEIIAAKKIGGDDYGG